LGILQQITLKKVKNESLSACELVGVIIFEVQYKFTLIQKRTHY